MASFNNVYRKAKDGSWKTKTDQKKDKLKDIFNDIAVLSNLKQENGEVKITPHTLILAMENQEKPKLHEYFGKKSTDELLQAFSKLDKEGNGAITLKQFIEGAEHAFSHSAASNTNSVVGGFRSNNPVYDIHEAEVLTPAPAIVHGSSGVVTIPQPPPMTRKMLYQSVFNSCDEDKKGYVSVKNLVDAMNNKRSDLTKIFGPQRSEKALEKFSMLDTTGDGRITFEEFFTGCEIAFTNHVSKYEKQEGDYSSAPAILVKGKVPVAPAMNRHLLYTSVFKSIDTKGKGKISQKDLTRAMSNRRGSIAMIFGHQNTTHAMNIFAKLDENDTGAVDYNTFAKNCEHAFLVDDEVDSDKFVPFPAAAPIGDVHNIPTPPPMTRELLYRSVYDEIDTKKKGTISQLDLVKAVRKGRRSSIAKIFGDNAIQDAVQAFQDMDVDRKGEVTWSQFFAKAEEAFVHRPNDRVNAPRRSSLKMRRASKIVSGPKAPPLPKS